MPKKKINNRLDKLFDEINEEAASQAKGPEANDRKTPKRTAGALSVPYASESFEPFSSVDISTHTESAPAISDASLPISAMLSTAFRTDERSWATLKIVDESEQRTWGTEEQKSELRTTGGKNDIHNCYF